MNENICHFLKMPIYEGNFLCHLMAIIIIVVWTFILGFIINFNLHKELNRQLEIRIKRERKSLEKEQEKTKLNSLYGNNHICIKYNSSEKVIISEQKQCIVVHSKEYHFNSILGYSLIDNYNSSSHTISTSTSSTSTGNMLKRAVVGGILAGGIGAITGATTASKNTSSNSSTETTIIHDYILYININSLENPSIKISIGNNYETAHKLANTINVIIEQNKKSQ